jgi:hypothetical protein
MDRFGTHGPKPTAGAASWRQLLSAALWDPVARYYLNVILKFSQFLSFLDLAYFVQEKSVIVFLIKEKGGSSIPFLSEDT